MDEPIRRKGEVWCVMIGSDRFYLRPWRWDRQVIPKRWSYTKNWRRTRTPPKKFKQHYDDGSLQLQDLVTFWLYTKPPTSLSSVETLWEIITVVTLLWMYSNVSTWDNFQKTLNVSTWRYHAWSSVTRAVVCPRSDRTPCGRGVVTNASPKKCCLEMRFVMMQTVFVCSVFCKWIIIWKFEGRMPG
jgi:hypothetical protein